MSEKVYNISDEANKNEREISNRNRKRISEFESDYAFTAVDFVDIADTDPANKALSRLSEEGAIKRIIQGGPYRNYEIAPYCIEFKHCANKEISGRSYITITVIQALKCIGKNNVQQEDIDCLSKVLKKEDKEIIVNEAITTTAWIYRLIKAICIQTSSDKLFLRRYQ